MPGDLPYLQFKHPTPVQPPARGGGFPAPKAKGPTRPLQWQRLGPVLQQLQQSLQQQTVELTADAPGASAEDVLVFDLAHSVPEFFEAVRNTPGMEWLAESEEEIDPANAQGFTTIGSDRRPDQTKPVAASLYMVATNAVALQQILTAWQRKAAGRRLTDDLSKFGKILDHVINVRRWDWRDRLKDYEIGQWEAVVPEDTRPFNFEIELWFRGSQQRRAAAEVRLSAILGSLDGRILARYEHVGCHYHGLCVEMPAHLVRELLAHPETSTLLRNDSVYHLWLTGQAIAAPHDDGEGEVAGAVPDALPQQEPELALFDGMPVENHPLLRDRLLVDDPDRFGDDYPAASRQHGTSMASIIVHGDLQSQGAPLSRPLYVRPIMRPNPAGEGECIPDNLLPLDLIQRAVIQLKQEAPTVKVVNLSIGDSARPFTGSLSAWARMLDWLQAEHNLVFVVSAGNAMSTPSSLATSTAFEDASPEELERDIMDSKWSAMREARLLSPAESVNALSVGATSTDGGGVLAQLPNWARHPIRSADLPAHASCIGPGFRKSVKPEFLISGGRQLVRWMDRGAGPVTEVIRQSQAPGIQAAAPPAATNMNRVIHTRGTSAAAAMATRRCGMIFEALRQMDPASRPDEEYYPVLAKALSVHPACWRDSESYLEDLLRHRRTQLAEAWKKRLVSPLIGYGVVPTTELMLGNDGRVTVLAWGTIAPGTTLEYRFPLPAAIHGPNRGKKRLTCTTAWLTPVHPGNARYRRVKLSLLPPSGEDNRLLGSKRRNGDSNAAQRGTVHHEVFEGQTVRGQIQEDPHMPLHLTCAAEAGEWDQPARYGIAVTLEVATPVFGEIYEEIRQRLEVRVPVPAT